MKLDVNSIRPGTESGRQFDLLLADVKMMVEHIKECGVKMPKSLENQYEVLLEMEAQRKEGE
jgi:hypothetical protein